jgi:hypothetical protein
LKGGPAFFISAICAIALISIHIFDITGNYASAEITMKIDSKIDGDDIRTDLEIDTPGNTRIDETDVKGDDRVNIETKTPRNGGDDEKEEKAASDIKGELEKTIDECDPLLQNDIPGQDAAQECERALEDANNQIDEQQNDLPFEVN